MLSRTLFRLSTLTTVAFVGACGTSTEPDPDAETGSVMVTVTTTGTDQDTGYDASIGSLGGAVGANASTTISGVPVGSRSVQLGGIAANCSVTGANPLSVTVTLNQTAAAAFAVVCTEIQPNDVNSILAAAIDSLEVAMFAALNIGSVAGLDDFSFEPANSLFAQALLMSPSNDTAAFGVAVTTVFMLEDDSQVRGLVEDWDAWLEEDTIPPLLQTLIKPALEIGWEPATLPLGFSTSTVEQIAYSGVVVQQLANAPLLAHDPPPDVTEMQTVLRDVVRPAMIDALAALAEINSAGFVFTLTEAMQGEDALNADPLELDYTEVLALRAGVDIALATIGVATAYTLTPNPLSATGFVDAFTPGSTFLTLASGGGAALSESLDRLLSAAGTVLDGLDALEAEVDDQTDDIIKYDASGLGDGLSPQDIADARAVIQDVQGALSAPTVVTINEGQLDEFAFTLDAREFFIDPIADFKALLPDYEVFTAVEDTETVGFFRWTDLNLSEWTFPDPTFSGLLPGMTTAELIDPLGFDEFFFELSLTSGYYQLFSVDGVDCFLAQMNTGFGCPVGSDFFHGGTIDINGYDGMPQVYLSLSGQLSFVDASGTYVVTDNQDGTHTIDLDMVTNDGTQTPLVLAATLIDSPGYTVDQYFRSRGGSSIEISYLGSVWLFEKLW